MGRLSADRKRLSCCRASRSFADLVGTDLLVDHTVIDPGYHRLPTETITGAPPNYRCRGDPVGSARPANGWLRRTPGRLRFREQLGPAFLLRIVRVFDLQPPDACVVGIRETLRYDTFEVVRAHQLEEFVPSPCDR